MNAYQVLKPFLFRFPPEAAHNLVVGALELMPASPPSPADRRLASTVAGLSFPTPVGLAAGFDKDAKTPGKMLQFGFGFVEVGTVTPRPQPGNPGPRYFRLAGNEAVINRMGFPSAGHDAMVRRLRRRRGRPGLIGVNVGANKDSRDRIQDYVTGVRVMSPVADYLTINVSSPNTPGLRDLQTASYLRELLDRVSSARIDATPIFLKVAPDLDRDDAGGIARECVRAGIDGIIVANTTTSRPASLSGPHAGESGGLSGRPLKPLALRMLRLFRAELGGRLPLIGVGGISSPDDAYERIRAGADLIQLYTAVAYQGPDLLSRIHSGLVERLARDGFRTIGEAVGADAPAASSPARQEPVRAAVASA